MDSLVNPTKYLGRRLNQFYNFFQKIEAVVILSNSISKTSVSLTTEVKILLEMKAIDQYLS